MARTRGHPKSFKNGEELLDLWAEFCEEIADGEFKTIPSKTAFCRWIRSKDKTLDRKTVYNSLNKYFPDCKKGFEEIQADTIMQGGMSGKYQPTMSIFGLKNWCGWGDSGRYTVNIQEAEDDPLTRALKEEAEKMNGERK